MQTINLVPKMPSDWLSAKQTAKLLGKGERTVQQMARDGRIRTKVGGEPSNPLKRLYDANDVERILAGMPVKDEPSKASPPPSQEQGLARAPKPSQGERALDMVNIVGNIVAGHKAEIELQKVQMEMLVTHLSRSLESVVGLILSAQKAESDANRERLKAEREDAREQRLERREWEREREERRKTRLVAVPAAKARKAGA
jgi:hypothetical protein